MIEVLCKKDVYDGNLEIKYSIGQYYMVKDVMPQGVGHFIG